MAGNGEAGGNDARGVHQDLEETERLATKTEETCREFLRTLAEGATKPDAPRALVAYYEAADAIVKLHDRLAGLMKREDADAIVREAFAKAAPIEQLADDKRGSLERDVAEAMACRLDDIEAETTLKFARHRLKAWQECLSALRGLIKRNAGDEATSGGAA